MATARQWLRNIKEDSLIGDVQMLKFSVELKFEHEEHRNFFKVSEIVAPGPQELPKLKNKSSKLPDPTCSIRQISGDLALSISTFQRMKVETCILKLLLNQH